YQPKVNIRGRTRRAVVDFLATAPGGFGGPRVWAPDGTLLEHGPPLLVPVSDVARAVYEADTPTAGQRRTVQRAIADLRRLGIVVGAHGWHHTRQQAYMTRRGFVADMPVSALYVALAWQCDHLGGGDGHG